MEKSEIIIYIKRDENNSITSIRSNIFIDDTEDWEEIDRWKAGEDRYLYTHADNGEYVLKKYGKPLYDERGIPNYHGNFVEWNEEEKKTNYPSLYNAQEIQEQENTLQTMMAKAQRTAFLVELPDSEAATIPYCYPTWNSFIDKPLPKLNEQGKENRIEHDGKLWKVRQDIPVLLENQPPSIDTASLYEVINVEHEGTLEDPIHYDQTMTVFKDKYYIEDEIIYKCLEDSGQPLYASCKDLPRYFEKVE